MFGLIEAVQNGDTGIGILFPKAENLVDCIRRVTGSINDEQKRVSPRWRPQD
jgi:hypothetical protein